MLHAHTVYGLVLAAVLPGSNLRGRMHELMLSESGNRIRKLISAPSRCAC